jgi:hypothetical protein
MIVVDCQLPENVWRNFQHSVHLDLNRVPDGESTPEIMEKSGNEDDTNARPYGRLVHGDAGAQ